MKSVPLERRGDYIVKMYELEHDVCRQMLARCSFGRVAFGNDDEGLTILPVNCVCTDDAVLFRAQAGLISKNRPWSKRRPNRKRRRRRKRR